MKNLLILTALISCVALFAFKPRHHVFSSFDHNCLDSFPNKASVSNAQTLYTINGGSRSGIGSILTNYNDTSAANLTAIKDYAGATIFASDTAWIRNVSVTKWIPFWTSGTVLNDTIFTQRPIAVDTTIYPGHRTIILQQADGYTGVITWSGTGLTFNASNLSIRLNNKLWTFADTTLTLDSADATYSRYDVFGIDTLGAFVKKGVPSPSPAIPTVGVDSFAITSGFLVNPGDTVPANVTQTSIFNENLGYPTEFLAQNFISTVDFNNTDNPYRGIKDAFVSSYHSGGQLRFLSLNSTGSAYVRILVQPDNVLTIPIYSNGRFNNKIYAKFYDSSFSASNDLLITTSTYGFNPNDSNVYQVITIPFSAFSWSRGTFTTLALEFVGSDTSGAKGLYVDYLNLQNGITPIPPANNYPDSSTIVKTTIGSDTANVLNDWYHGIPYPRKDTIWTNSGHETLQQAFDKAPTANPQINAHGHTFYIDSTTVAWIKSSVVSNITSGDVIGHTTSSSGISVSPTQVYITSISPSSTHISTFLMDSNNVKIYGDTSKHKSLLIKLGAKYTNDVVKDKILIHADTLPTTPSYMWVADGDTLKKYPYSGGGCGNTIYTADDSLTSNRTVALTHDLTFISPGFTTGLGIYPSTGEIDIIGNFNLSTLPSGAITDSIITDSAGFVRHRDAASLVDTTTTNTGLTTLYQNGLKQGKFMVNVLDSGAVGDSATDDTQSFENVLSYLRSVGGGIMYVPKGIFRIRRSLFLPNGVELRGAGRAISTITKFPSVKSLLTVDASQGATSITVASSSGFNIGDAINIQDTVNFEWASTQTTITNIVGNVITLASGLDKAVTVARNAFVSTTFPMIRNDSGATVKVDGLTINQNQNSSDPANNFTIATIHLVAAYNSVVENCTLENAATDAYSDQSQDGSSFPIPVYDSVKSTKNTFRGNIIQTSNRHGVHLGTVMNGALVTGNIINNCGGMALFYCAFVTNTIASNNLVQNCAKGFAGGDNRDSSDIIEGNTFVNIGSSAWTIEPGPNAVVSNNIIINSQRGILIQYPDCQISNNYVQMYAGAEALRIVNADRTIVTGGILKGKSVAGSTGLYISGSNDVKISNLLIDSFYIGASIVNCQRLNVINSPIKDVNTNEGWVFSTTQSTDVNIDLRGTTVSTPVLESVVPLRALYNGLGTSWAVNPSYSQSQWHLDSSLTANKVYDGAIVRWNDGTEHASIFRDSIGWKETILPQPLATTDNPTFKQPSFTDKLVFNSSIDTAINTTVDHPVMYASNQKSVSAVYPFDQHGNMILQPRSVVAQRDFIVAQKGLPAFVVNRNGQVSVGNYGLGGITANLQIKAGRDTIGGAALKIDPGVKTTTPEKGAVENDSTTNHLYWTDKNNTRYQLDRQTVANSGGSADSLKTLPIDTSANTTGNVLAFDATLHKWYLTVNGGTGWLTTGNTALNRTSNYIGSSDTSQVHIKTKGTDAIVIDSLQNVGIGISSPVARLDVRGGVAGQNIQNWRYYNTGTIGPYIDQNGGIFTPNTVYTNIVKTNDGSANGIINITGSSPNYAMTFGNVASLTAAFYVKSGGSIQFVGNSYFGAASTPTSTLQVGGSFSTAYRAITALRTLDATDNIIECTSGTYTVTLPTSVGIAGREYWITNTGSGTITIGTTSSQTFINVTGTPTTLTVAQFTNYKVVANGANWLAYKIVN